MKADGSIIIDTRIETDGIDADLKKISNQTDKHFSKMADSVKKIGALVGTAFATSGLIQLGKDALEAASNLQEIQNVVDVTFPEMSKQINQFAKDAAKTAGLSETMAKEYAGTFGTMARSMGYTEEEAYKLSTAMTQFTGDLASFRNLSQDEAFKKLQAVFTGETESLKELGVVMTQTNLDAYALANGFGKTTSEMTEQEKVALRYQYVMDQLSAAQGDYVRTSDSWANQTKNFQLQLENLMTTIGSGLIELLTPALQTLNDNVLPKLVDLGGQVTTALTSFSDWITENEPLIIGVTGTIAAFFAAWALTDLLTWTINAGGVVSVLHNIATAFTGATAAKLADKAVDLQLIALYSVDYIKAFGKMIAQIGATAAAFVSKTAATAASTAAEWAHIAATTAWNAICTVATTVTTAFGAAVAFLTSPIGLVIVAITALIAIVVLLVQNWDTVKEVAATVWERIQTIWANVANWFSTNVTQPIVNFFSDMGDAILGIWNDIIAWIVDAINDVVGFFNSIFGGSGGSVNATAQNYYAAPAAAMYSVEPKIPYLATGAVIPPKSPFMAVLGDQKNGTNLEAPESLLRQIVREESGGEDVKIEFTGELAALARILTPVITKEQRSASRSRGL